MDGRCAKGPSRETARVTAGSPYLRTCHRATKCIVVILSRGSRVLVRSGGRGVAIGGGSDLRSAPMRFCQPSAACVTVTQSQTACAGASAKGSAIRPTTRPYRGDRPQRGRLLNRSGWRKIKPVC